MAIAHFSKQNNFYTNKVFFDTNCEKFNNCGKLQRRTITHNTQIYVEKPGKNIPIKNHGQIIFHIDS